MSTTQKAFCNDDLLPGYYIEKNGDTVQCQIDYKDWNQSPESITVTINEVQKSLGPADIRGFGVTGYCEYQSADISYHLGPISGGYLPQQYLNKTETKNSFLLVLVSGPYSLYAFTSPERTYYFVSENGAQPQELVYQVKQADMLIGEDAQYRTQLMQYLTLENLWDQESGRVSRLGYTKAGFMALVVRLNEAHTGKKASPLAKAKKGTGAFQIDLFAGATLHSFPGGVAAPYPTAKLNSTISPEEGIGCRIVLPGHFGAYSFGFGIGYTTFRSSGKASGTTNIEYQPNGEFDSATYSEAPTVSNSLVLTNFNFMYMIPKPGNLRFYAKIGVSVGFVRSSAGNVYSSWDATYLLVFRPYQPVSDGGSHAINQEAVRLRSSGIDGQFALGCQYGRHRLELEYDSPMELADSGEPSLKLSGLGLRYIFTVIR